MARQVDRVPPADLIEAILTARAMVRAARSSAGSSLGESQKMRGLIRRIQNRGYATWRALPITSIR